MLKEQLTFAARSALSSEGGKQKVCEYLALKLHASRNAPEVASRHAVCLFNSVMLFIQNCHRKISRTGQCDTETCSIQTRWLGIIKPTSCAEYSTPRNCLIFDKTPGQGAAEASFSQLYNCKMLVVSNVQVGIAMMTIPRYIV